VGVAAALHADSTRAAVIVSAADRFHPELSIESSS
jgi:hypothetical protein